jgi:hypothetical protein
MKNRLNIFIFIMILGIGFTPVGYSAESTLRFSLLQSEIKVDDLLKHDIKSDNKKIDIFAKDNVIYLVNSVILLDAKDILCSEMLGTSYAHGNSSGSSTNIFQIGIIFNDQGKSKLSALSMDNRGKRLAIVFDGELIITPIIEHHITDGNLLVNGLSYDDARRLDYALHKACAWASDISYRLVTPYDKCTNQKPLPKTGVENYECLSMENQEYSVSKKAELDSSGFKNAKIFLTAKGPFNRTTSKNCHWKQSPGVLTRKRKQRITYMPSR